MLASNTCLYTLYAYFTLVLTKMLQLLVDFVPQTCTRALPLDPAFPPWELWVRSLSVHDSFGTKGCAVSVHDDFGTYEINFGTRVFVVRLRYMRSTVSVHH